MSCKNCTCCTNAKNQTKSKPKSKSTKKYLKKNYYKKHCSCDENIYIPDPYTNNCCDAPRIVGGTQGNVEKAECACTNINKYY